MKTLQTLVAISLLFTFAAWFALQGVSEATIRNTPSVPLAEDKTVVHTAAPQRANLSIKKPGAEKPDKPEAPKPKSALQTALEAADLCETSRILNQGVPTPEIYSALMAVIQPSPALQEAYGPHGPMLAATKTDQSKMEHKSTRLLWALKLGGLAYLPVYAQAEDHKAALELLLDLEKKDSGNAAYPFFRLYLEEKLTYSKEKLAATAEQVAAASVFDARLDELDHELRESGWLNPAVYLALNYVYSGSYLNHYNPIAVLRRLESEGSFSGVKRMAQLMAEQGLRATRSSYAGGYDRMQYSTAKELDPQGNSPSWRELSVEQGVNHSRNTPYPWTTDGDGKQLCDPGPYEAYFYEVREELR